MREKNNFIESLYYHKFVKLQCLLMQMQRLKMVKLHFLIGIKCYLRFFLFLLVYKPHLMLVKCFSRLGEGFFYNKFTAVGELALFQFATKRQLAYEVFRPILMVIMSRCTLINVYISLQKLS